MSKRKANEEGTTPETSVTPEKKSSITNPESERCITAVVAEHYNSIEEKGLDMRNKSRIVYLRNFNNWIKSMLINEYVQKYKKSSRKSDVLRVMDMCCGKGGDLLKWKNNDIEHLICVDVARVSVEQCEQRFNDMKQRNSHSKYTKMFSAEFIVADCTKVISSNLGNYDYLPFQMSGDNSDLTVYLKDRFQKRDDLLDIISCQFSFHYSFETLPQAECMIRNVADNLRTGGYFIGTIPDANDIVLRLRNEKNSTFGNDVFRIQTDYDVDKKIPLFGAKYDFFLEDVVNCPEFLVHFPTFVKLAGKFGLEFVKKERFYDYYERLKNEGRGLLGRMQAVETYPPFESSQLQGKLSDYTHADEYLNSHPGCQRVGTLSLPEWEAGSLYLAFAFMKVDS